MELGLSLGEAMADAGRELVLGLGVGPGATREGEGRRDHDVAAAARRGLVLGCGSSPEPTMRLALLPMVPSPGFPWPSESRHLEASTRGFDVNQAPSSGGSAWGACAAAAEEEQEDTATAARAAVSSSPNDSGGSFPMDFSAQGDRGAGDAAPGGGGSRGSDEDDGGSARKKLRLSKEQAAFLEESFKEHSTLNPRQKVALAKQLNLRPRQVEVWFQNRRARTKLKQTEVDCEYLKRCCETLTEENRRLQKELAELRALKTVHPFYMHLPATTLSMCPSCERVASNSAPGSAAAPSPAPASAAGAPTSGAGIGAAAAPEQNRPSSFAALFSSARSFPLASPQPQAPLPAPSSS